MRIILVNGFGSYSPILLKLSVEKACKDLGYENLESEILDVELLKDGIADIVFCSPTLLKLVKNKISDTHTVVYPIHNYMDLYEIKDRLNSCFKQYSL